MKTLIELYESLEKGNSPASCCIRGDDPFVFGRLVESYRKRGFDLKRFDVTSSGPGAQVEAEALSMSLFGSGILLWLESRKTLSSWSDEAHALLDRLLRSSDGVGLTVVLLLPEDRRIKSPESFPLVLPVSTNFSDRQYWIAQMNAQRGGLLDDKRLSFLSHFEEPLMVLDNWLELWTLGGDLWAKTVLCWGDSQALDSQLSLKGENPAFAWVDAVIDGHKARAMRLLEHLLEEGSDPIQLTALLAKSARIAASISAGESLKQFPSFLINKLRSKSAKKNTNLLQQCAHLDLSLKSTSQDAKALLLRLSA